MTLLLIDTAVQEYETIVAAAQSTVTTVLFDRAVDTFQSLKQKIAAELNGATAQTVGIVQHGSAEANYYRMLETQVTPAIVGEAETHDPSITSWSELIDFYGFLKLNGATTIDLISCALYANQGWVYVLQQLESRLELNFRASVNNTGNIASGGDWILESDGINIQSIYFTEDISQYTQLLHVYPWTYQNRLVVKPGAMIGSYVLKGDTISSPMVSRSNPFGPQFEVRGTVKGNVVYNWGDATVGNLNSTVATNSGIVTICSNRNSVCYLKSDGTVFAWGNIGSGGSPTSAAAASNGSPVVGILAADLNSSDPNMQCYVALRQDGTVYSWGGTSISTNSMVSIASSGSPAVALYSTKNSSAAAFAALRENGSVAAFGSSLVGGNNTQAALANNGSPVVAIAATQSAFAALRENGTVYVWGNTAFGGDSNQAALASSGSPVVALQDTTNGFAALRADGSVYSWPTTGSSLANEGSPVVSIASTSAAFAALRQNGTVYAWGTGSDGGSNAFAAIASSGSPVVAISSGSTSFVALRQDGSIYAWGAGTPNSMVSAASSGSPVVAIFSSNSSHSCLRENGTVYSFGADISGQVITSSNPAISISSALASGYCALLANGTVAAWGNRTNGGSNTTAQGAGSSGIILLKSGTTRGFTTIRSTNPVPANASDALANDLLANYINLSADSNDTVSITSRAAIKAFSAGSKQDAQLDYIKTMKNRLFKSKHTIASSQLSAFKETLISGANNLSQTKEIDQYYPTILPRNNSAFLEINDFITDRSKYICIELPYNIPTQLLENGALVKTLFFDGTNVRDGATEAAPILSTGSSVSIGTKTISKIAIGSLVGDGGEIPQPLAPTLPARFRPSVRNDTIEYYWDSTDPSVSSFTITLTGGPSDVVQTLGPNARNFMFTGLMLGTTYTASIVASSSGGNSNALTFQPVEACNPPSAPQTVTFDKDGADGLIVTWTAPALLNGSPVQGYLIYNTLTEDKEPRFGLESFRTSTTITGLAAGSYRFAIAAFNSATYGESFVDPETKTFG